MLDKAKQAGKNRLNALETIIEWTKMRKIMEWAKDLRDSIRDETNSNGAITIGLLFQLYDIYNDYLTWYKQRDPKGLIYLARLNELLQRNIYEDSLKASIVKPILHRLTDVRDTELLPYLKFVLDYVVLSKRGQE
jgi:hypothetical protein